MKAAVAFTVGLWTGALAIAAVGLFYFYWWGHSRVNAFPATPDETEIRLEALQQQNAQATAEVQRLRETVAELESRLASSPPLPAPNDPSQRSARRIPFLRNMEAATVAPWIVQSVLAADPQALPKLEQAALQNDLNALDAVALLADLDNAETLTRVWSADSLTAAGKNRATLLVAATVEVNPHGEELLLPLATNGESLVPAALMGLATPGFATRLTINTAVPPPPHFKPDYALRLRILDNWRAVVTNETLAAAIERVHSNLTQRASETAGP